jgi:hypothetical protein
MQLKSRLASTPNSGAILRHFTMYKALGRSGGSRVEAYDVVCRSLEQTLQRQVGGLFATPSFLLQFLLNDPGQVWVLANKFNL